MGGTNEVKGPDLTAGVEVSSLADNQPLLGQVRGESVMLVRKGDSFFAIGATCTHYGGPLAEGLVVDDTVRCPWHHACFSLRTGEAVRAPALAPVACYTVERRGERVFVTDKTTHVPTSKAAPNPPESVVIVGAGAAGMAAAEMLRRLGYQGRVLLLGADAAPPVDRPNLSKDYLAGNAPEEWIPLKPPEFYAEAKIELLTGVRATALDVKAKKLTASNGQTYTYGALLLATGAEPVKLTVPGADLPHVHTLRHLADSRAIIEQCKNIQQAVVIGASFIGLEAAASLRARNVEVHVVGPEAKPLEKVLGPDLGDFVKALHEEHGVHFYLQNGVNAIERDKVILRDGSTVAAQLVVTGIGVRPSVSLAEAAGLKVDNGIVVDEHLQTSAPNVYAAGDVARWPEPRSGQLVRIEHWVVAQRMGQTAARNLLGQREPFDTVPFFWSQHYDVPIAYVGVGLAWEKAEVHGSAKDRNVLVAYRKGGRVQAVASIYRDLDSLKAEAALERNDQAAVESLLKG
jgi:NADPH-dependent 2,4-dienoyl-CoA reductase/sulfur reductase-like enzyme/nitrite reductase/ring-hydroxylating ferredoxin subunit